MLVKWLYSNSPCSAVTPIAPTPGSYSGYGFFKYCMEIFLFGSKIFKIDSLSNQNDLTLPKIIFELLTYILICHMTNHGANASSVPPTTSWRTSEYT